MEAFVSEIDKFQEYLFSFLKAHLQPTVNACRGTIFIYENPVKLKFIQSDRYHKQCEFPVEKPVGQRWVFKFPARCHFENEVLHKTSGWVVS